MSWEFDFFLEIEDVLIRISQVYVGVKRYFEVLLNSFYFVFDYKSFRFQVLIFQ